MKTLIIFKKSGWLGLCLVSLLTLGQSRRVDWIHGLGGNANSWQNVATNTGRQITGGTRASYTTGNGIPAFASDVQAVAGGANTIAISHSLGGTATRQVDINNPSEWSSVITVGSPLRGAQIAVSTQNGVAQNFVSTGVTELLRGPSVGSVSFTILGPLGILIRAASVWGTLYSNNIAGAIVNAITSNLSLTPTTAADLNPAGSYMQNLSGQGTGTPKIQIWGNEVDPVLWRVAGTFASQGDAWGVNLSNDAAGLYHTAADIEYAASWVFIVLHGYYNHRGHQWMAGANWIRHTSNPAWQNVIGAASFQTQQVQVLEYDLACGEAIHDTPCPSGTPNCPTDAHCYSWVWREMQVYTVHPTDGVVPANSQRNDGGAWRGYIREAPGVNHMEMLEWGTMQPTLDFVFNRQDQAIDEIFRIDPQ